MPSWEKPTYEILKHKEQYDRTLWRIYNPPFLSKQTVNKRKEASELLQRLNEKIEERLLLFMAPAGSVGLGIAGRKSDVDGVCFYSLLDEEKKARKNDFYTKKILQMLLDKDKKKKFGELEFINSDKIVSMDHIRQQNERDLFVDVLLFAPVINEFNNKVLKTKIDGFRAEYLANLIQMGDDFAKERWRQNQKEFALKFAYYGEGDVGDVDRGAKFFKAVEKYLKKRVPATRWTEYRVNRVIDGWREKVQLPGLEEMCLAFGVKE